MARLWAAARMAEMFGVLPSQALRDLDEDSDQVSLACMSLINYSRAKRTYDGMKGDRGKLKKEGVPEEAVDVVQANTMAGLRERNTHRAHARVGCAGCSSNVSVTAPQQAEHARHAVKGCRLCGER